MTTNPNTGLLPAGLSDLLAPDAGFEADLTERVIAACELHGYERVKPPMMEFESSLLSGTGAAMDHQVFRLMDPVSQRMMGLRADITPQIARIAESRLSGRPRPLRLCYAGQVLRVRGDQIRPERQFAQIGAELIGNADPAADAEVIFMAADALRGIGVSNLSIDLGLPTLIPALTGAAGDGLVDAELREALDHKDSGTLTRLAPDLGAELTETLIALVGAAGPADDALAAVAGMALPQAARTEWVKLEAVINCLRCLSPTLTLTIDPVEHRGFEYHAGVTFTLYAAGVRGELGSGGRYRAGGSAEDARGEPATGFTLFTDTLLRALTRPAPGNRIYLPPDTPAGTGATLRDEGWITVAGLGPGGDPAAEAERLNCTHWLAADGPRPINTAP